MVLFERMKVSLVARDGVGRMKVAPETRGVVESIWLSVDRRDIKILGYNQMGIR